MVGLDKRVQVAKIIYAHPTDNSYPRAHYCGLYGVQLPNLDWLCDGGAAGPGGTKIRVVHYFSKTM